MPNLPLSYPPPDAVYFQCVFCHEYRAMSGGKSSHECTECNVEYYFSARLYPSIIIFHFNKKNYTNDTFYYLWIDYEKEETGLARRHNPLDITDGVIFRIPQVFPGITPQNARQLAKRLQKLKAFS